MTPAPSNHGFTLLELSIVLIIIGFISGGVLIAKDLIRSFEARAQVAQIESINSAVNAFRGKYDCLPGDCPDASDFNLGNNGDGDGKITLSNGQNIDSAETAYFWSHLSAAN